MGARITVLILFVIIFFSGCAENHSISIAQSNEGVEAIRHQLKLSVDKNENGIPEIIEILNHHMKTPHSVTSWGVINDCVRSLDILIDSGIYTEEVLPALLQAIKKQISIKDTLVTARAIEKLTRVDVGYSKEFVDNYEVSDEKMWLDKIAVWEKILEDRQKTDTKY